MGFDQSSIDEIDGEDISPSSVSTDSLDTGDVDIDGDVDATTLPLIESTDATHMDVRGQETATVGTQATVILTLQNRGGLVSVMGGQDGDPGTAFHDLVLTLSFGGTTVVNSVVNSSPAGRTYSLENNRNLQLSMGADTYNIVATGLNATYE